MLPEDPIGIPIKALDWSTCVNLALKVSTAKAKSNGEKGSPWHRPAYSECIHGTPRLLEIEPWRS